MATNLTPTVTGSLTEQVAEEIRALLARRRIKQSQLARALGVSEQWVSVRLMGKQEIGLNELERIAAFFAIDYSELQPRREGRLIAVAGTTPSQGREITSRKPLMPKGSSPLRPIGASSRPAATPSNRRTGRVAPSLIAARRPNVPVAA